MSPLLFLQLILNVIPKNIMLPGLFFISFLANGQAIPGFVNVKDYGAVGDGQTDDTHAIHHALEALPEKGGVLYFPAGHYLTPVSYTHLTLPTN